MASDAIHGLSSIVAPLRAGAQQAAWIDEVNFSERSCTKTALFSLEATGRDGEVYPRSTLCFLRWDEPEDAKPGIWVTDEIEAGQRLPARRLDVSELRALGKRLSDEALKTGRSALALAAAEVRCELAAQGVAKIDGPPPLSRDWSTLTPASVTVLMDGKPLTGGGSFNEFRVRALLGGEPVELALPFDAPDQATLRRWDPSPGADASKSSPVPLSKAELLGALNAIKAYTTAHPDGVSKLDSLVNFGLHSAQQEDFSRPVKPLVALNAKPVNPAPLLPTKDPITGERL